MARLAKVYGKGSGAKAPTPPPPPPAPPGRVLRSSNNAATNADAQAAAAAAAAAEAAAKKAEAAKKAAAAKSKKGLAAAAKAAATKKANAEAKAAAAKLAAAKKKKGKGKKPEPQPESESDEEEEGDDDDDDAEDAEDDEPPPPAPPKKGKKSSKKAPKPAATSEADDDDDDDDVPVKAPKKSKKAKKVAWTDDDASENEKKRKRKRSERYSRGRESEGDTDDVDALPKKKTAGKRSADRSPSSDDELPAKRVRGYDIPKLDFSHFDEHRLPGPDDEEIIPRMAREVLETKMQAYMPLHYFADEMIAHERSSCVIRVSGPAVAAEVVLPRNEENMTVHEWKKWGERLIDALIAYGFPDWIPKMFTAHFRVISKIVGYEKAWPVYRAYDLKMRAKFVGRKPPNIKRRHLETWESCLQDSTLQKMVVAHAAAMAPPKPRALALTNAVAGPSNSTPREPMLKYDRCLVCGNKAHRFAKGKTEPMPCTPAWLVWHTGRRFYLGPPPAAPGLAAASPNTATSAPSADRPSTAPASARTLLVDFDARHHAPLLVSPLPLAAASSNARASQAPDCPTHAPQPALLDSGAHAPAASRPRAPDERAASLLAPLDPLARHAPPSSPPAAAVTLDARADASLPSPTLDAIDFDLPDDAARPHVTYPFDIVTPLKAEAWELALEEAGLLPAFGFIPQGLLAGFDVGISRADVDPYFAKRGIPFKLYDNHGPAIRHPSVIEAMIAEEQAEGRISDFFEPDELHRLIGTFRNAPLTIAEKNGSYANGRVCQDFSHPRKDPDDPSFNSCIDQDDFSCDWGSFSRCYLLAANAPEGTEVAVFDVKAAHRRIPILPWQQAYQIICWNGKAALNFCAQFGAASSSGLWGRLADTFRGIFKFRFRDADVLNWADDFTFWRYVSLMGGYSLHEDDIYALADELGWPWSAKKTRPFSHRFPYLGFTWDLQARTVAITEEKKLKYLRASEGWVRGAKFSEKEAQSLLGKLVHCTLVMPEGRSRLPALSRFAGSFANRYSKHEPNATVIADIAWWRERLEGHCGMCICRVPEPADISLFVDASTGWGVGIVLDGSWDHWRLLPGWDQNSRDIGWAEMVAVEFGLRAAIERGANRLHLVVHGDNKGVCGALDGGKSRNPEANRVLQRIVTHMLEHGIWLSTEWVPSAENIADAPSRGLPADGMPRRKCSFQIPYPLREYLEEMP